MQQELGRQQAAMGKQQKALRAEQLAARVQTPDFKRDMAELERVMRQMDLEHLTPQIDQKALAELQSRLGEIQSDQETRTLRDEGEKWIKGQGIVAPARWAGMYAPGFLKISTESIETSY